MYKMILEVWATPAVDDAYLYATKFEDGAVVIPQKGDFVNLRSFERGQPSPLRLPVRYVEPLSSLDGFSIGFVIGEEWLSSFTDLRSLHGTLTELGWDMKAMPPMPPAGADEDDFEDD